MKSITLALASTGAGEVVEAITIVITETTRG
jgi:hypothetical protein